MADQTNWNPGPGGAPGDGWWMASDGQWYPPSSRPGTSTAIPQQQYAAPPQVAAQYAAPQPGGPPHYGVAPPTVGYPPYVPTTPTTKSPGLAIAAMVLGICSLLLSLVPFLGLFSIPFALTGVGLGIAGVVQGNKTGEGKGMSIAGLACSAVAIVVSVAYITLFATTIDTTSGINSDPSDGICNSDRFLQDPDC